MPEFGVNLARTRVPPLAQRRKSFRNMVLYLLFCGLALAGVIYAGARDLVQTSLHRTTLHSMEQTFRESHPEHRNMLSYATDVESRGAKLSGVLNAVQKSVAARADVALILAGITSAMPAETRLLEFSLDSNKGIATFELAAPIVTKSGELTDPGTMVGLWNGDAALASVLQQIRSVETQRQVLNGEATFVLRFAGKLPGGKG